MLLAERAGIDCSTLENYVNGDRRTCSFDIADRLLCATGLAPHIWWGELREYYEKVDFSYLPPCEKAESYFKKRPELRSETCRNGHPRTPENTMILGNGKHRCRICNNESSKRSHHRRKGDKPHG